MFVGRTAFVVDTIRFDWRLDGVAWWSSSAASRDYLRVTLIAPTSGARSRGCASDAWVYVDRRSGEVFLQGFWE